jgi:ligand-binding sensor protein
MELRDIMTVESWRQLAEGIYTLFGLNGTVLDKNNTPVHSPIGWANQICPDIKGGENRILCASAQQSMSKIAEKKREPVIDECEVGFAKFVVPIFLNDEFLGTVSGCGCLLGNSETDAFYIGKLLKKKDEEIKGLLITVRRISQDKVAEAIRYVQEKVKEILSNKSF